MIFVSHAAADKPLVDAFYTLLQTGCSLRAEEVFCTSIEGAGVETGEEFVHWIKEHLLGADLVILFVTPNYLASRFCIAEMGAAWALEKAVFPLLSEDVDRDLGTVFLGRYTDRIDQTGLNNLFDRISAAFPDVKMKTARWDIQKSIFLEDYPKRYSQLPKPSNVARAELENEKERTSAALEINEELRSEVNRLSEHVTLLEAAKDPAEVAAIRKSFANERERYDSILSNVKNEAKGLDKVELRCVFAAAADSWWTPGHKSWDYWSTEIDRAKEREWIIPNDETEPTAFIGNGDHPRYRKLFAAIRELDSYLTQDLSEELRSELEEEGEHLVSVRNREFWEDEIVGEDLLD